MILLDLAYALRVLRQRPLVTLTIVLTLGLGIGANTAMFSLLNAVVLRTLAVPHAEQLFSVNTTNRVGAGLESARLSGPMFDRLRSSAPEGVGVAAVSRGVARVYTRADGERDMTPANLQLASSGFFPVLGLSPALGRLLPDDRDGASVEDRVAVVSHGYWQRRFGGAPSVVGRTVTINGAGFTVVGVGPRDFTGVWLESPVDIWVPLTAQSAVKYSQNFSADGAELGRPWLPQERIWWLYVIVRSPASKTAAALGAFTASLSAPGDARPVLEPFARGFSRFRQQFSMPLVALVAMAALVLLVACANVANLLLARAAERQREMGVRMALGAGRVRLIRQLLTESALLVALAGAAAILFASWAGDLLVRTATAATAGRPFTAPVDLRVLGFTAALAFASVLLCGLVPAWRATRVDLVTALASGARGATAGFAVRLARLLVIPQVALSLVLVTTTGLFVRSFENLLALDLGIERERLLSVTIDPRLSNAPQRDMAGVHQTLLDAAAAIPGVQSASLAMCGLQSGCALEDGYRIEGYQARPGEEVGFRVNAVSPSYFSTVGMRVIAGRALSDRDLTTSPKVAVVNRALAAKYFRDGSVVGRRFGFAVPDVEIVGIVEDARALDSIKQAAQPTAFFPLRQRPTAARSLDIRTSTDPRQAIAAVRAALGAAAPDLPIESIVTIEDRVRNGLSREQLLMFLTSGFGALALGLAGFGLFGVLSYAVARRTPEFGVRMALGASRSDLLLNVVREAVLLVVCGVLLGLPFVFLGGSLVSTLVFGIGPHDRATLAVATAVLVGVGAGCGVIPALRASRVDPMVALRQE